MKEEIIELFDDAKKLVIANGYCSLILLKEHFGIGDNRAGMLIDALEDAGVIESFSGSKRRKVLINRIDKIK